jgi:hypothetical protein
MLGIAVATMVPSIAVSPIASIRPIRMGRRWARLARSGLVAVLNAVKTPPFNPAFDFPARSRDTGSKKARS